MDDDRHFSLHSANAGLALDPKPCTFSRNCAIPDCLCVLSTNIFLRNSADRARVVPLHELSHIACSVVLKGWPTGCREP